MTAHATGAGLDTEALDRLRAAIEGDIEAGLYDGAVVMLGRHGEVALHEAIGWAERDLTFVVLTSGVLAHAPNIRRFHRLSDMAAAAAL